MKINAIKKLCMGDKLCRVLTGAKGQQWIGGRDWITKVDDGLTIDQYAIQGLFDLSKEEMTKLTIEESRLEMCSLWPILSRTQVPLHTSIIDLNNMGGLEILGDLNVVYMVEKKKIKAAVDSADYREYLLGWDTQDNPLIIINDGMIFAGVVRPLPQTTCKGILDNMRAIGEMRAGGTANRDGEDQTLKLPAETGKQLNMDDFDAAEGE